MTCHRIPEGFLCCGNIYEFAGFIFEVPKSGGSMKLNKDLEPSEREGRLFWEVVTAWSQLPKKIQERTRVHG